jgi:hypothetical protein
MQSQLVLMNYYHFECIRNGKKIWEEVIKNLIPTAGLNDILDKYFKGTTYTAAWYVGLINNVGWTAYAAADTLASHAGWTESTNYSGNRSALTLGSVSAGSVNNSASKASFTIGVGGAVIKGAFICTVNTGTSGILYGEGSFSAARTLVETDVLNATVTLTSVSG